MNGLKLIATGRALPEKAMTNDDMRQFVDTSDEWISTRTGIHQRYFCGEGENTTSLSIQAARIALEQSGVSKEDIGCVLVATSSGEYAMPSTACLVHAALELPQNIPAMDVGAACAGFLFAMETARGLLLANDKRYALVIGAEGEGVSRRVLECFSATAQARRFSSFARTRPMSMSSACAAIRSSVSAVPAASSG